MNPKLLEILLIFAYLQQANCSWEISTSDLTPEMGAEEGWPVFYGDFNGDKMSDIVTLDKNRTSLRILLGQGGTPLFKKGPEWNFTLHPPKHNKQTTTIGKILSIFGGDFTGNGRMDLMVTFQSISNLTSHPPYKGTKGHCTHNKSTFNATFTPWVETSIVESSFVVFCLQEIQENVAGLKLNCSRKMKDFDYHFVGEPGVGDFNGDFILDLVGEIWTPTPTKELRMKGVNCTGDGDLAVELEKTRTILLSAEGAPASMRKTPEGFHSCNLTTFAEGTSPNWVDFDGDAIQDLLLLTKNHTHANSPSVSHFREVYKVAFNPAKNVVFVNLSRSDPVKIEDNDLQVLGQSLFLDLERKGQLVQIIPFCHDKDCERSGILASSKSVNAHKFSVLPIDAFSHDGLLWNFPPPVVYGEHEILYRNSSITCKNTTDHVKNPLDCWKEDEGNHGHNKTAVYKGMYNQTLILHAADVNLDGYPDLIAVVQTKDKNKRSKAIILENVPCQSTTQSVCLFSRTFRPNFSLLERYENVSSASFFDLKDDGVVDVILALGNGTMRAVEVTANVDSYFLKASVLSGRPCLGCLADVPYGNLLSGANVKYKMLSPSGWVSSLSVQSYRSSSLGGMDLPFNLFGIGHTPNWIDEVGVSFGYFTTDANATTTSDTIHHHSWHQLIPNSQIVVIPSLNPSLSIAWNVKLFLTPSPRVLETFGVLTGILCVVGVIAAGLQWKERLQDKQTRVAEAQRFLM